VTAIAPDGSEETAAPLRFTTPGLPTDSRDWPTINVRTSDAARVEPGYVFASIRRRGFGRGQRLTPAERRFTERYGLIVAFDADGRVVWYYRSQNRIAGIERLRNGNILFHTEDFRAVEIDMLGNVVRQFYPERRQGEAIPGAVPVLGIQTLHHQPLELPNGHFLAFSANARRIQNYYTSETDASAPRTEQTVMGDTIVEFDGDGGVVWSWNAFDHLDVNRIGYQLLDTYWWPRGFPGALDWTHGNGMSYDERHDAVVFYLKHQDAVFSVDRRTGAIRWIFGDPSGWSPDLARRVLRPVGQFRWPYHGHNPRLTEAGTIVMYDNGNWGARPFTGVEPVPPERAFSRAVEYRIDERNGTVREIWASASERSHDTCLASGMGDVHRLPRTANILVFEPGGCYDNNSTEPLTYNANDFSLRHVSELYSVPRIREYARGNDPGVVWEITLTDRYEVLNWQIYGGFKTPTLSPRTR
jgi:hypothetical protein